MPQIGVGVGIGRRRRRGSGVGGGVAPTLTGPLSIDAITGEATYAASIAARHYWALTAPATTPDAPTIAAGTGALDHGFFDAPLGSVAMDIAFATGINVTGAVFSIVARVEPAGPWSNVLRDTTVDVNTSLPITRTFISAVENSASPNFGTRPAGEYILVVMQRSNTSGSIDSVTPPGETIVTTPIVAVNNSGTLRQQVSIYRLTLTAARSGAWTIGRTNAISTSSALYALSGPSQTIASPSDFSSNAAKTSTLTATTQAGDVLIVGVENGSGTIPADSGSDAVASDAVTAGALGAHRWRALSGVAAGGSPETVCISDISLAFTDGAIAAVILRKV